MVPNFSQGSYGRDCIRDYILDWFVSEIMRMIISTWSTGPSFGCRINLCFDLSVSAKLYSGTGPVVRTLLRNSVIIFFLLSLNFNQKRRKKMKNNNRMIVGWKWKKRSIRYFVNNNIVVKILKRVGYELRELFWLGVGVGILVVVVNLILFLGF